MSLPFAHSLYPPLPFLNQNVHAESQGTFLLSGPAATVSPFKRAMKNTAKNLVSCVPKSRTISLALYRSHIGTRTQLLAIHYTTSSPCPCLSPPKETLPEGNTASGVTHGLPRAPLMHSSLTLGALSHFVKISYIGSVTKEEGEGPT
jgi:hypothetical protein